MKNLAIFLVLLINAASVSADSATERLQEYLRIDTINPPGSESKGVAFLARLLDEAGISYETAESVPGRGNIWARLKGGDEPALILLHHIDVVPANAEFWDFDPLSGEIHDGYIYGRGAIDTKGLGIAQLEAFIALKESGKRLNRDVIYMATADEEAGGLFGAGWLIKNRPELFEDVGYLINEGGSGMMARDHPAFSIEVTQKVPLWLRLTATDMPGHGSAPRVTSSVKRIVRAGQRIATTAFEKRVLPEVAEYFSALARYEEGPRKQMLEDIESAVQNKSFMMTLQLDEPWRAALLSNTCSLTTLQGSEKINVVPPQAALELDCRLLPGQDPDEFIADLETIINDDQIEITKLLGFTAAVSDTNTPLYGAIQHSVELTFENAVLIPSVAAGFTDSHFFRDLDIVSYGFAPFLFLPGERTGIHGNNERISILNLERGVKVLTDLLYKFATE
ncbi:MAG: M20/M25/M40 family metallo-hydrolase [Pseudomonadales bacterium]|nr:M20/M25/M40 family metallo-hydrolase [Pseudomonadales bacterium]MBO6566711.1 M20/M25/M40 family metallo-hydrolase [Pseudomonadales bacterium]MBO6594200.1 M20/M25/M40 family metallo-hydrolase [Pseudomonadales bacterium]MBO6700699.1 M20/M25/M40 family metallo-hydrolase [Pseudomonadales bacterium]MBO6822239.1 M20/M25/M40 family metallo-hydrolase [Pseudomonadales bacterium]